MLCHSWFFDYVSEVTSAEHEQWFTTSSRTPHLVTKVKYGVSFSGMQRDWPCIWNAWSVTSWPMCPTPRNSVWSSSVAVVPPRTASFGAWQCQVSLQSFHTPSWWIALQPISVPDPPGLSHTSSSTLVHSSLVRPLPSMCLNCGSYLSLVSMASRWMTCCVTSSCVAWLSVSSTFLLKGILHLLEQWRSPKPWNWQNETSRISN